MPNAKKTEQDHIAQTRAAMLDAALAHVCFDGWSAQTFDMAVADSGVDIGLAHQTFPRGAIDMALAYHRAGDQLMLDELALRDLSDLRFRDRIALAVKLRLQASDKEAVRRGMTLFALPQNTSDGAQALWGTVDAIWNALGDTSDDVNWYTKRGTLSAVYSATVLFWLGDTSEDNTDTWAFLDRRIENVMQFEKVKSNLSDSVIGKGLAQVFGSIKKPSTTPPSDLPGYVRR
ncbi:ubiquinone biosynthesis protein [Amylibacter kogurei]|uniref:Ubiquinone biosynthesis protein n=1 Tax=Paramylibacter kogurei TaxID=1889778 RepID=A0A2G5KBW2_9RHOB|nr:COQ9 family protein [Amylibacter kogurei]PIB26124.1 ubiquinone biosynthesis protein [Amylibacter kogurei]